MARWLACTVLAAFILGDPARAEEATGRDRFWVDAEVLGWKIGDAPQPTPLVTAGSLTASLPGALGQPGTSVQIGGTSVSLPIQVGGRFALGTWIERAAGLGIGWGPSFWRRARRASRCRPTACRGPPTTRYRCSTSVATPAAARRGSRSMSLPGRSRTGRASPA
jgi:hypothetical protein